jgi:GAF domain-containing protein
MSVMSVSDEAMREISALSAVVLSETDLPALLEEICRIAIRAVPGAEGASVTTVDRGNPATVAVDEWSRRLDELQFEEHEGPCLDAYRTGTAFRLRDITSDTRWPSYLPKAASEGLRSMLSCPMAAAEGSVIGAVNLYSRSTDAFDVEAASLAEVVAAHAGLATQIGAAFFGHRDLAEQLADAMQSRAVIEQAKGVIIAMRHRTTDEAWNDLVRISQRTHRKLRDVAADLVDQATKGEADLSALD